MRQPGKQIAILAAVAAVVCASASLAVACPSCQAALANDASSAQYARGVQYSILFMLSMPFTIAGVWGCAVYRMVKRERTRVAEEQMAREAERSLDDTVIF